ncbi:glycosyltransferase family 2 protein [Pseudomaricurvus alcaniphilus]|uniref:glycosyltransferase family 2 protein n=1 Tax=Pseudomaricurvus alcaniphilus TaxID=1166482 RepID=UPI0014094CBE|nr:glycosyltransferase family 2 protein [Pseudomaricurvus alcaniphilus]NHN38096.1 glycosyltransferase family 2 protein [Pseudomaricurvus alcaniphilus]
MTQPKTPANNQPLISVLMAAYNAEHYIQTAINSILSQTYSNLELIIIDDASTDSTWEKIQELSDQRIKCYQNPGNLGYLKTCNKLFSSAQGQFITFQDADDWSAPLRLETQLQHLQKNEDILFCGTFCAKVFNPKLEAEYTYPVTDKDIRRQLARGRTSLFCGASIMFRRKLLEQVGGYRELFDRIGAEDIDWYLRALDVGKACNIPATLYYYRQHQGSISKSHNSGLSAISTDIAYALYLQRQDGLRDAGEVIDNLNQMLTPITPGNSKSKPSLAAQLLAILLKDRKRDRYALSLSLTKTLAALIASAPARNIIAHQRKRRSLKIKSFLNELTP